MKLILEYSEIRSILLDALDARTDYKYTGTLSDKDNAIDAFIVRGEDEVTPIYWTDIEFSVNV